MGGMTTQHPYSALTPDLILDAVDALDLRCDGRLLPLASYENRVYQVGQEDGPPVVVKFYRPGRWSVEAIQEEHDFALALQADELPVVAPLQCQGRTLHQHAGFLYAVFPRRGGRQPELEQPEVLAWIGRLMARFHVQGGAADFRHRPRLDAASFGDAAIAQLRLSPRLPAVLAPQWLALAEEAMVPVRAAFDGLPDLVWRRCHGDCHPGNILWTPDGPHFVDLDDSRMAPAVQDLWMLLPGERSEQAAALADLLAGYEDMAEFDYRELRLIEPLRTLRLLHYAAWLDARQDDPAFAQAFAWFGSEQYWHDQCAQLREQLVRMALPPLFSM